MLSVTDELLTYINVRSFHYILLIIEVDDAKVEIFDSLAWPQEKYQHIKDVLQGYFQSLSYYIGLFCSIPEISSK